MASINVEPRLADAFGRLDESMVRWCLLRGERNLHNPPGDVDILVARSDRQALDQALGGAGFRLERSWAASSQMTYETSDPNTELFLHVVTRLDFRRTRLRLGVLVAAEVLERRRRVGTLWVPGETDAFWVTLAHLLLDKGRLSERHRDRLFDLAQGAGTDTPLATALAKVSPDGWDASRLLLAAQQGAWSDLEGIAPFARDAWLKHHRVGVLARRLADRYSITRRRFGKP